MYYFKFKKIRLVPRWRKGVKKYKKLKHHAAAFVKEKIAEINKLYNFSFNRVCVKNHKSRWGSCSRKGNLSFNYRIALLPPRLADYIIVHELCHLTEFNHSSKFWALVAKTFPEHKAQRKELRGYRLSWDAVCGTWYLLHSVLWIL